jgi:hypothetical protein
MGESEWTTIYWPHAYDQSAVKTIVLARRGPVSGVVTNEHGEPVAGADVVLEGRVAEPSEFGVDVKDIVTKTWEVRTGSDGRFSFHDAPVLPELHVTASESDHVDAVMPVEARSFVEVVLPSLSGLPHTLSGTVVDANGNLVKGAGVGFYSEAEFEGNRLALPRSGAITNAEGRFFLGLSDLEHPEPRWLVAAWRGLPVFEEVPRNPHLVSSWPQPLVLKLGESQGLSIRGALLTPNGEPVRSVNARVVVGTSAWPVGIPTFQDFTGGSVVFERSVDNPTNFGINLLAPGFYRLRLIDNETLRWQDTALIEAGTKDVRIRLQGEPTWPPFSGIVVGADAQPVLDASFLLERPLGTGRLQSRWHIVDPEDGRFEVQGISRNVDRIGFRASGVADVVWYEITDLDLNQEMRIHVPVACRLIVDAGSEPQAAFVSFADARGAPVRVTIQRGHVVSDLPLNRSRSGIFQCGSNAAWVRLVLENGQTKERAIRLNPSVLNRITW